MSRERFPLTSDQLELLVTFEKAKGLTHLAELLARDPSVVSRNLRSVAETLPVLVKRGRRWHLTPLGRQLNLRTKQFVGDLRELTKDTGRPKKPSSAPYLSKDAALLVINAQMGLHDPTLGRRNNSEAENNIHKLLTSWRKLKKPVIHVRHISGSRGSLFFSGSDGARFISLLEPKDGELQFDKRKSSAFSGTTLQRALAAQGVTALVLAGFTANECIDATARDANELDFDVSVVGDATAMFDFTGPEGRLYRAERVHQLTLANLHTLFATILQTSSLLKQL